MEIIAQVGSVLFWKLEGHFLRSMNSSIIKRVGINTFFLVISRDFIVKYY